MSEIVIKAENISKRYRIGLYEKKADTLAKQLLNMAKAPINNFKRLTRLSKFDKEDETVFWALKNINFDVRQGEVLGIVGKNGAGKSTLLKILSRITDPSTGKILIKGRVSSLLEVGTGFHAELSGRENIYMNGTILGMTKKEIDNKLDEIIDFSGIIKHIDTPVKFYSSGMKVRLAFSVAAHLEPEILIIDEVLAVGDVEFQKKCLGKMEDVASGGRTVLFVSHNLSAVKSLCSRAILLNYGEIIMEGNVDNIIHEYLNQVIGSKGIISNSYVSYFKINDKEQNVFIGTGETVKLNFAFKNLDYPIKNPVIKVEIQSEEGNEIASINTYHSVNNSFEVYNNTNIEVTIPSIPLNVGAYYLILSLKDKNHQIINNYPISRFNIIANSFYKSGKLPSTKYNILLANTWSFN